MAQNYFYPAGSGGSFSNASIGVNGTTAPTSSTQVAGVNPSGNLQPISVDGSGNQNVNVLSSALPSGAATAALQTAGNASLSTIATNTTGVATAANQTTGNNTLSSILTNQTNGTQVVSVNNFPATQPVSGTVTVVQPTGTNLHTVVDSGTVVVTQPTGTNLHTVVDSGTVTLGAGSAIVGQVSINQTTPGVTNGVQVNAALPAGTNLLGSVRPATPPALTITQAAISVGTTAVRLTVAGTAPASTRVALVATPDTATLSTVTFYIGSATVTNAGATRGAEIQVGQTFIANNDAGDYYIVASAAAQTVTVMEQA